MKSLIIKTPKDLNVCLVDADASIREIYSQVLEDADYKVQVAQNYDELIAHMNAGFIPDIIITDEDNAGPQLQLAQKLREINHYNGLIILFAALEWKVGDQRQYIDAFLQKLDGPKTLLLVMNISYIFQATKKVLSCHSQIN